MAVVLSFATITLNDLPGLRRTYESIAGLLSTRHRVEWVVWDGGSSDGTAEWLAATGAARWSSGADQGIYDAMNRVTAMPSGKYVVYLNSGDEWLDSSVVGRLPLRGSCDLHYGSYALRLQTGRELLRVARQPAYLKYSLPTSHQAIIFPLEGVRDVGLYDDSLRVAGDYDLVCRMVSAGATMTRHDAIFARFYTGGQSTTRQRLLRQEAAVIQRTVSGAGWSYVQLSRMRRLGAATAVNTLDKLVR